MKTYIKPSIEKIAIGVHSPIVTSPNPDAFDVPSSNPSYAPGKKGSSDDWEDEDDLGW